MADRAEPSQRLNCVSGSKLSTSQRTVASCRFRPSSSLLRHPFFELTMTELPEELSGEEIVNAGARIVWTLRQLNEGFKVEGLVLMDDIIEQVENLLEQTTRLGDRIHEYGAKIARLENQIIEAHEQNEMLQAEMRAAREERDELLSEVEENWEKDVLSLRAAAEAAARDKTQLALYLAESRQDLEHLRAEKKELESDLIKYQLALTEREQVVSELRDRLDLLEKEEEEESDQPGSGQTEEEICEMTDSGVDTSDLRRARHNQSLEERLRNEELLLDLEMLSRKCQKLESDKEELEARLTAHNPDSSPESSFFRPRAGRSRSLQEELTETSFYQSVVLPGGDADRTPAMSSLNNYTHDESFYMECETRTDTAAGCPLEAGTDGLTRSSDSPTSEGPPTFGGPSDEGGKRRKGRCFRWTDLCMCLLLYFVLDVISFTVFGQHLITVTRIERHNQHTAIF